MPTFYGCAPNNASIFFAHGNRTAFVCGSVLQRLTLCSSFAIRCYYLTSLCGILSNSTMGKGMCHRVQSQPVFRFACRCWLCVPSVRFLRSHSIFQFIHFEDCLCALFFVYRFTTLSRTMHKFASSPLTLCLFRKAFPSSFIVDSGSVLPSSHRLWLIILILLRLHKTKP